MVWPPQSPGEFTKYSTELNSMDLWGHLKRKLGMRSHLQAFRSYGPGFRKNGMILGSRSVGIWLSRCLEGLRLLLRPREGTQSTKMYGFCVVKCQQQNCKAFLTKIGPYLLQI